MRAIDDCIPSDTERRDHGRRPKPARRIRRLVGGALCGLAAASATPVLAASCPAPTRDAEQLRLSADQIKYARSGAVLMRGRAQVEYDRRRMRADSIRYSPKRKRLVAKGNVQYTGCPTAEPLWFMSADEIISDADIDKVAAKDIRLFVGNTPVLSIPRYLISSEEKRKTGFLTPDIGYNSNSGYRFATPFYLNLAPNYDFELAPTYLSKRGLMASNRFRALGRHSKNNFDIDWINDTLYADHRYFYNAEHTTRVNDRLRLFGRWQRVSDREYVRDISPPKLNQTGSYLRSHADLNYAWRDWLVNVNAESFQLSDANAPSARPFRRAPHIDISTVGRAPTPRINYALNTHYTSFSRQKVVTGDDEVKRMGGNLMLTRPWTEPGYHFTPGIKIDYTHYQLTDRDNISRTVPTYGGRAGMRRSKLTPSKRYIHTFEPELAYAYTPEKDQSRIPLLDTKLNDFDLNQILENNRYNGLDRIDNTSQLGVALNSRLLDAQSGEQIARLGVGQIRYFERPNTCLYYLADGRCRFGSAESNSDYVAEFEYNFSRRAQFNSAVLWDTQNDQVSQSLVQLSMRDGDDGGADIAYRKRRRETQLMLPDPLYTDSLEQVQVRLRKGLFGNWKGFANWHYDLRSNNYLELLVGAKYAACCWDMSLMFRRYVADVQADADGDSSLDAGQFDYDSIIAFEFSIGRFELGNLGDGLDDDFFEDYLK